MSNLTVSAAVDTFMQGITQANLRSALALGDSSTKNVGNSAGTVAAGDDSRIVNAIQTGSAASLASLTLSTPLAAIYGGTGQSVYVVGDILYASTTTALTRLPASVAGSVLTSQGVGVAPTYTVNPSFSTSTVTGTGTAPYFRVINTGISLDARMGSSFNSSLFGIGTVSAHDVGIYRGNTQVGLFNAGGFNGIIGGTTPAAGTFTTLASNSNANIRTTKGNFHITVNVKDYGAIGDGSTDDTAAINSAIAALTNYSTLLFPYGDYKITAGLTSIDGLSHVSIIGQGARIHNTTTGASGNTFVVTSASTFISFDGLSMVGSATIRGSGIHIRLYSGYSSVTNCYFEGCSDFGVHISNDSVGYNVNSRVENCVFNQTLGDGVHAGCAEDFVISGNIFTFTGDDSIGIVADDAARPPARGTVANNQILASGSDGIRIDEASDILVTGNNINTTVGAGIEINRFTSTTAYNSRIIVKGNKLTNTQTSPGPLGAIGVNFANDCSVSDNEILTPANGGAISYLDVNNLTIRANTIKGSPVRAIASNDSTTTNVAATWSGIIIQGNSIQSVTANEAIYAVPATGKTITNLLIDGNVCNALPAGNYIFYARVTTGVISNNVSRDNRTVANGGTVSGVTEYNNTFASALGTLAIQNANAVAITGGSVSGLSLIDASTGQIGNLIMKSGQVNEYTTNGLSSVDLNFDGYNGGTTQFRNVNVYDGKNALVAAFTGMTKSLNVVNAISAATGQFTNVGIGTAPLSDRNIYMLHSATSGSAVAAVEIAGSLNAPAATDLHANAYRDSTTYTSTVDADAYASYDSLATISGTHDYNHFIGFQSRINSHTSGTLGRLEGFTGAMTVSLGHVTEARMFYVPLLSVSGGATVDHYAGIFMDQLSGATTNDAIYCNGTNRWFSAGGQIITSALLTTPAGDATMRIQATFDQATQTGIGVMNSSATATGKMISFFNSGGTYQGGINQTNSTTIAYATSSDSRLKENIRNMTDSGSLVDAMLPRIFDWKWGGKNFHGFIAQELDQVFPEAVSRGDDSVDEDGNPVHPWGVDFSKLVPVLVAEVKDLRRRIALLEA